MPQSWLYAVRYINVACDIGPTYQCLRDLGALSISPSRVRALQCL